MQPLELKDWAKQYSDIVEIGEWSYGTPKMYFWDKKTRIKIGKFCSIADKVTFIAGGNHRTNWITTFPFTDLALEWDEVRNIHGHPATKGDIIIGNDVWIGYSSIILSGTIVGDGVSIGAGSVITPGRNVSPDGIIPPYSILAGNPARVVGYRFSPEEIDLLLKIQWWNWPIDKIKKHVGILCSENIDGLREICK